MKNINKKLTSEITSFLFVFCFKEKKNKFRNKETKHTRKIKKRKINIEIIFKILKNGTKIKSYEMLQE